MPTVKTAELTGEALNWAAGKARGLALQIQPAQYGVSARVFSENPSGQARYRPVVDGGQAFELLEHFGMELIHADDLSADQRRVASAFAADDTQHAILGPDNRTAICRCAVAVVFGAEVDVPEALL
jgi:hypothetical protein